MICPFCQNADTRVTDSRDSGESVRRRRECEACGRRFTTQERLERRMPQVVKKGGEHEPFDREKLRAGLAIACRKRPVSADALDAAVAAVEQRAFQEAERGEISSMRLGALVLEELLRLDRVAYLRFASVYQELGSPEAFLSLLQPLLGESR